MFDDLKHLSETRKKKEKETELFTEANYVFRRRMNFNLTRQQWALSAQSSSTFNIEAQTEQELMQTSIQLTEGLVSEDFLAHKSKNKYSDV